MTITQAETIRAYWFACEDKQGRAYSPNAPRIKWVEGQTRSLKGEIVACYSGYHASPSLWDALQYAPGPLACLVELSGDIVPDGSPVDKYAARTRKLIRAVNVERELRLFAADCAEHVLYLYEGKHPGDDRPRKAIEAARAYAEGKIDQQQLAAARTAAGDAAWATAWAAAGDAAGAAVGAAAGYAARTAAVASAGAAARAAVGAAAGYAARTAARNAARTAAGAAERAWQSKQFDVRFGHIFVEVGA